MVRKGSRVQFPSSALTNPVFMRVCSIVYFKRYQLGYQTHVRMSEIQRKGETCRSATKDKSARSRFIFLHKILLQVILNPPYHQFSTQLFKNIFLGNFIQILFRFQKLLHVILNAPGVQVLSWKNRKIFLAKFHSDFGTISKFVHILFGTISDDQGEAVVFGGTHTRHI